MNPAADSRSAGSGGLVVAPGLPLDGLLSCREEVSLAGDEGVERFSPDAEIDRSADETSVLADDAHDCAVDLSTNSGSQS